MSASPAMTSSGSAPYTAWTSKTRGQPDSSTSLNPNDNVPGVMVMEVENAANSQSERTRRDTPPPQGAFGIAP